MARIRTIKPEFWTDKKVAQWPAFTRLLFIGLWSAADDHGRGSAELVRLAAELFPYDLSRDSRETLASVSEGLAVLSEASRITLYEVNGECYYQVENWTKHQRVDKPGKSRIPAPLSKFATPSRDSRETVATLSRLDLGSRIRDLGPRKKDLLASEINLEGNLSLASGAELKSSAAAEPACRTGGDAKQEPRSGSSVDEPKTPEPPKSLATPPVMVFPCRGAQSAWALSTEQVARWSEQYPGMDIAGECRKALAWLEASPTKQKTSQGMQRFLVNWLNRSADRPGLPQDSRSGVGTTPRTPVESFAAERQRLGRRSRLYLTLKTELKLPEFHARHLSAEFDQLLTEEEGVKAAIKALVERGLATFDGRVVTMTEQKPSTDGIDHPPTQPQARITQSPERRSKGTERQGLVSLHELFTQPRKEKSA
jgi:hypothetical protein